jgi:GGDEF domain-containing protein
VARWGGEEFCILIVGAGDQAASVAQRIVADISAHPFATSAGKLAVTASAGSAAIRLSDRARPPHRHRYRDVHRQATRSQSRRQRPTAAEGGKLDLTGAVARARATAVAATGVSDRFRSLPSPT